MGGQFPGRDWFRLIGLFPVTQTTVESTAQPVLLMLVDISGYTKFMVSHGKELRHSQMIIGALLESLMDQVDVPLRVSYVEGDALLLYAIKSGDADVWRRRSQNLVVRLLSLFEVFRERLLEIGAYSVCNCGACVVVGDLKLKIIAHSGEALLSRVGEFPTRVSSASPAWAIIFSLRSPTTTQAPQLHTL